MRPTLAISAFAAACALLNVTLFAAQAQPAAGDDSVSLAQIMFARINEARHDSGLPPYRPNAILTDIAVRHAREIAANNHYSHTGLDGRPPKARAIDAGYGAGHAGIRIGENFVGRQHLDDGFQWLMDDPPHRANMLHPGYREAGVGAARMSYGYVWVIDFGMYDGIDAVLAAADAAPPAAATSPTGSNPAAAAPSAAATTAATAASPVVTATKTGAALPAAATTPAVTATTISAAPSATVVLLATSTPAEAAVSPEAATPLAAATLPATASPPGAPPPAGLGSLPLALLAAAAVVALVLTVLARRDLSRRRLNGRERRP